MLSGDEGAQGVFYKKYQGRLYATCVHFLGFQDPECEDLVQETYVLAFKNIAQFDFQKDLYSWLNKICVNLCFQRLKRRQRLVVTEAEALEAAANQSATLRHHDAQAAELKQESMALIKQAFKRLGEKCRQIIQLRDFDGLSYMAIAKQMQLAPGTVFSRLARCRSSLKQLVTGAGSVGGARG